MLTGEKKLSYNKVYYANHKQKQAAYYKTLKVKWVQLLGGKCVSCGYNKCIAALDLHHKGRSKDECNHEYMRKSFILKIQAGKIELLCSNCHRELHYKMKQLNTT